MWPYNNGKNRNKEGVRIIGLSGRARSGKDTVGNILVEQHGFQRLAFADALKEMTYAMDQLVRVDTEDEGIGDVRLTEIVDAWGWENAKSFPEVRRALQYNGVAARKVQPDFWIRQVAKQIIPGQSYVITDVRFENEVLWVNSVGGEHWRVERPGNEDVNQHISETALDQVFPDYTVMNDGSIADLEGDIRAELARD